MLNWELRDYLKELRDDGRLALLVALILHANIRLRCWPSMPFLIEETAWGSESLTEAKKWLLEHKAIMLVPHQLRVDEERQLPNAKHVYQLTGVMQFEDKTIQYLYMTPEAAEAIKAVISNISVSEYSVSDYSPTENKGISIPKDDSISKVEDSAADAAPTPPHIAIVDAYHNALPDDVRPPEPNYSRNVAAARKLRDAGITPDEVTRFVSETYPTYRRWARKQSAPELMSLDHVVTYINAFLAREDKSATNQPGSQQASAAAAERQRQLAERFAVDD